MAPKEHTVRFTAIKTVKKPTEVGFKTRSDEKIAFEAKNPTKLKVKISFQAKD